MHTNGRDLRLHASPGEDSSSLSPSVNQSCPARPRHPVYICLTVVPTRHALLEEHVVALLDQTFTADILIAYAAPFSRPFSDFDSKMLEIVLERLDTKYARVHVLSGRDQGPGSKILFPLRLLLGTDALLIAVDDDQVYAPSHACDLVMVAEEYPDAAITRRSRILSRAACAGGKYEDAPLIQADGGRDMASLFGAGDIVMGTSGYLVRTRFFTLDIFSYRLCPSSVRQAMLANDDLWISAHLRTAGVPVRTVLPGFVTRSGYTTSVPEEFRSISRDDGLWRATKYKDKVSRALGALSHLFCEKTGERSHGSSTEDKCRLGRASES